MAEENRQVSAALARLEKKLEQKNQVKSLQAAFDEYNKAIEEMSSQLKRNEQAEKRLEDSIKEGAKSDKKRADASKTLGEKFEDLAKKLIGVDTGKVSPTDFVLKQQIPFVGLRAKIATAIGRDLEKIITAFSSDFSKAFSSTIDTYIEGFQRQLSGGIQVYQDKLEGRKSVRDEIISSLGPMAKTVDKGLVHSLFNTKVNLLVDPSAEGANRVKGMLQGPIEDFAGDNAKTFWNKFWDIMTMNLLNPETAGSLANNPTRRLGSKKEEKL